MGLREKTGLHRRMLYYLVVGVIVGASLLKPSKGKPIRFNQLRPVCFKTLIPN